MSWKKGYHRNASLLKKTERHIIGMSSHFINKIWYRLTHFIGKNFWGFLITVITTILISQYYYDQSTKPDFKLLIDNPPLENYRNSTFDLNITVEDINNYNKSVILNTRAKPDGVKVDFSYNNLTPSFYTPCKISIPSNISNGTYSLLIDGNKIHPKNININIRNRLPIVSDLKSPDLPTSLNRTHIGFIYTWKAISKDLDGDPIYFSFFLSPSMSPKNRIRLTSGWSPKDICKFPVPKTSGNYTIMVCATDFPDVWQNSHLSNCSCLSRSFSVSADNLPDNNTKQNPSIESLNPDRGSPKPLGTSVNWTAKARDPENDPISYRFLINDTPATEWQSQNQWIWTASEPGTSQIGVQVKDEQLAGPPGMGSNLSVDFTITAPIPEVEPAKINEPPILSDLTSNLESPQILGTAVTWTAQAVDAESNNISYRFLANDTPATVWQTENQWTWTTSEPGTSHIVVQVKDDLHAGPQGEGGNRSAEFIMIATAPLPVISNTVDESVSNEAILDKTEERIPLFTHDDFLNELEDKKISNINFETMKLRNPLGDKTQGWCIEENHEDNKSMLYRFPYCIKIQQLGINDISDYTIKLYLDDKNAPQFVTYTKTNTSTWLGTDVSRIPQERAIAAIRKLSAIST